MQHYSTVLIQKAVRLRSKGQTYEEIQKALGIKIPKGTLHSWLKNISASP